MSTIGERIKLVRNRVGETQSEFAAKANTTQSFLSHTEKGRYKPTEDMLGLIVLNYGVNKEWLETGSGEMYGKDYVSDAAVVLESPPKMKRLDLLEVIIMHLESYLAEKNKKLAPTSKAKLIIYFYKHFMDDENVEPKEVKRIVDGSVDILLSAVIGGK